MNTIVITGNVATAPKQGNGVTKTLFISDNGRGENAGKVAMNLSAFKEKSALLDELKVGDFRKITGTLRQAEYNGHATYEIVVRKVELVAKKASA